MQLGIKKNNILNYEKYVKVSSENAAIFVKGRIISAERWKL